MTGLLDAWQALDRSVAGELLLPGSTGYESARGPAIERFAETSPAAVLRARTAAEVAAGLDVARSFALPVAVRAGGHDFAGRSRTEGLLIDLSAMHRVRLTGHRAEIEAGARLEHVYRALSPSGRTVPAGCGPSVGIGGLTLGGGLGVLGRTHGLTCDRLVAARVVLADGRTVPCDQDREPELFWALRGAGAAGLGVVTDLTFDTVPSPHCTVFRLTWDYRHAARLVTGWQRCSPEAPDALAASLLLNAAADPRVAPTVTLLGAAAGQDATSTDELLAGFTAIATPETRWLAETPLPEAKRLLDAHAPGAAAGWLYGRSEFFREPLPAGAVEHLVRGLVTDRTPGEARELDFTPWGGGYNRIPATATAFPHRAERFLLKHAMVRSGPRRTKQDWLAGSWQAVHPYGSGGVYPNFPDPELSDPERAYFGENAGRVAAVRRHYDPDGLFTPSDRPDRH